MPHIREIRQPSTAGAFSVVLALAIFCLADSTAAKPDISLAPAIWEGADVEKNTNEKFLVTCSTTTGAALEWLKNGKPISDDSSKPTHVERVADNLRLVFENVTKNDHGKYVCQGTIESRKFSKYFTLKVLTPIKFEDAPHNQSAREGKAYTVKCKVRGDPKPIIKWSIGDKEIENNEKYKIDEDGLKISNVREDDEGVYTCAAVQISSQNFQNREITFRVEHKPRFLKDENAYEHYGIVKESANLTCEVEALPPAKFTWLRDKKTLKTTKGFINITDEENKSTLQILVKNHTIFGSYTCRAKNNHGEAEKEVTLREGEKPTNLTSVTAADSTEGLIELVIEDINSVIPPVQEYVVRYIPNGGDRDWNNAREQVLKKDIKPYVISGLEADTTYHIKVAARNKVGLGPFSQEFNFTTTSKELLRGTGTKKFHMSNAPLIGLLIFSTFVYYP